jgi:cell division septal protein FtsQ
MLRRHKYFKPKRKILFKGQQHARAVPNVKNKKINFNAIKKNVIVGFFILAFCWFIYFFFLSDNFFIKSIKIEGNENITESELKEIINEHFNKKNLLIVPGRNIILFDKESLVSSIQKKYVIENISVEKNFPFELKITLNEKLARIALCYKTQINKPQEPKEPIEQKKTEETTEDKEVQVSQNIINGEANDENREVVPEYSEECRYLDANGIAVSSVTFDQNDKFKLPTIEIQTNDDKKINLVEKILDKESVEFVFSMYEMIQKSPKNISISYVIFDPLVSNEFKFVTTEGWQAFLSTQISLETQIKKLEMALDEKIKDQRSTLQFVDLRIKDRVYFK